MNTISNTSWSLLSYHDPFSNEMISMVNNSCNSSVIIDLGGKSNLLTTIDNKWKFKGKYQCKGSENIKINSKINEQIYLDREKCESNMPSTFSLKIMLNGVNKYEVRMDTLVLFYPKKNGGEASLVFEKR
jgi:hypothetical protein